VKSSAPPNSLPQRESSLDSFKTTAVYVVLLAAVAHLIVFHLAPDAPIWQNQSPDSQQLSLERGLAGLDRQFIEDAGGGNLLLHFQGFDFNESHQGLRMSQFYFRANYALYPRRAFIGRNDRILNYPAQMSTADVIPDDNWLKQHDVRAVRTLTHVPSGYYGETRQIN
jgi:hypothetical protein